MNKATRIIVAAVSVLALLGVQSPSYAKSSSAHHKAHKMHRAGATAKHSFHTNHRKK